MCILPFPFLTLWEAALCYIFYLRKPSKCFSRLVGLSAFRLYGRQLKCEIQLEWEWCYCFHPSKMKWGGTTLVILILNSTVKGKRQPLGAKAAFSFLHSITSNGADFTVLNLDHLKVGEAGGKCTKSITVAPAVWYLVHLARCVRNCSFIPRESCHVWAM